MLPNTRFVRVHPAVSGWPDDTNTGVLGASLTTINITADTNWRESVEGVGLFTTEVIDGHSYHVYSNYDFETTTGIVYLDGVNPYVKFKTCKFVATGLVYNTSAQVQTASGLLGSIYEDCTFDGGAAAHNRNVEDGFSDMRVLRCNCRRFGNSSMEKSSTGNGAAKSMDIRDSYFLEPKGWQLGDHIDALQTDGGMTDLTIVHNTVLVQPFGYTDGDFATSGNVATSCINVAFTTGFGQMTGNVLIDRNWIAGGGYCTYAREQGSTWTGSSYVMSNNVFDRHYWPFIDPHVSAWGWNLSNNSILNTVGAPATALSGGGWFGNTFEDMTTTVTYAMATA